MLSQTSMLYTLHLNSAECQLYLNKIGRYIYVCVYIYDSKSVNWLISQLYPTLCPWTVACQAPLSMGFSRQEYWNGLPFPSPGDLPDPGVKPGSPVLQADSLLSEPPGKPYIYILYIIYI